MAARLGNVLYWFCCGMGAIIIGFTTTVVVCIWLLVGNFNSTNFVLLGSLIITGVLSWLTGRAMRYILAGT
jgi:hypothetical protein